MLYQNVTTCSQKAEFRAAVDVNVVENHPRQMMQFLSGTSVAYFKYTTLDSRQPKDFLCGMNLKGLINKKPKRPPFSHFCYFLKKFNALSMQILQRVGFIFHLRSKFDPEEINFQLSPGFSSGSSDPFR